MIDNPSLFDLTLPKRQMKDKIRLIELFAGIGSQAKALKNLNIKFEHWKVCEIDKYAINSYNAIHNTNFTTSDITKLTYKDLDIKNTDEYDYIMTYSFPCQDLSIAGKMLGMEKESGTRSGLLWEVERLLKECCKKSNLPQILIMENVPQIVKAKGWHDWCAFLSRLGYSNYCFILNSLDFGIPQTRQRAFMLSLLGDYSYSIPKKIKLSLILEDLLDNIVDEKYVMKKLNKNLCETLENVKNTNFTYIDAYNRSVKKNISGTISCGVSNRNSTFIKYGSYFTWKNKKGIYNTQCNRMADKKNYALTIASSNCGLVFDEVIRKYTAKECWRLMGFYDNDYDKASIFNKEKNLYIQAGNSIVVQVLMAIFGELFNIDYISKINESLKKIKGE